MNDSTQHIGFDYENRFALYIEGEYCPFDQIDRHREIGSIPVSVVSLPATEFVRDIPYRTRIHLLFLDHRDTWRVFFEGEVIARGFSKGDENRSFQLIVAHVTGILDQFAISALEPAAAPEALMSGRGAEGTVHNEANAVSLKGSILELLTPSEVAKELANEPGFQKPRGGEISLAYWVQGAFRRYIRIVRNSRIANSYINKAAVFHRLMERITVPTGDALNWDAFYSHILAEMFVQAGSRVGERQTFFELLRTLVMNFLYEVVIEPGARSYKRQIQVKPLTVFNAIPKCNVLYPSLVDRYGYQEEPGMKPTRTEAHFSALAALGGIEMNSAVYRSLTVFGPSELQWKWNIVQGVKEPLITTNIDVNKKLGEITPPDPQFLTQEEEERGVVPNYFDVPSMLLAALMKLGSPLGGKQYSGSSKGSVAGGSAEIRQDAAISALAKNDPANRRHKYMALMALALGTAGGINRSALGGDLRAKYRMKDKPGGVFDFSNDFYNRIEANGLHTVPRRIVFVGTTETAMQDGTTFKNAEAIARNTGANYLITRNGTIIQLRGRNIFTWNEPKSIPMGLKCSFGRDAASKINSDMPRLYGDKRAKKGSIPTISGEFRFVDPAQALTLTLTNAIDLGSKDVKVAVNANKLDTLMLDLKPENASLQLQIPDGKGGLVTYEDVHFTVNKGTGGKPKLVLETPLIPVYNLAWTDTVKGKFTLEGSSQVGDPHQPFWLIGSDVQAPKLQTSTSPDLGSINTWSESKFKTYFDEGGSISEFATHYKRSYVAGNFGSLVVAFELSRIGATPSPIQLDAAAYLSAAVIEITAEEGFDRPRAINASGTWATGRMVSEIEPIQSYLGGGTYWDVGGINGDFYGKVDAYRAAFFTDFEAINRELTQNSAPDIAIAAAPTEDDSTDPPSAKNDVAVDNPTPEVDAEGNTSEEVTAPTVSMSMDMTNALKRYAAPIVNYQHHWARFSAQQTQTSGPFNPYAVIGYPCLMPDDTGANVHLVGYLHAVHDTISGSGQAVSQYSVTHIRPFKYGDDSLIPFSAPYKQHYRIREILNPSSLSKTSTAIKDALSKLTGDLRYQVSHLPIQLFGIGVKDEDRNPVPFVFDAGFGLNVANGKAKVDFSEYARFVGLGGPKGENWKTAFVFQDTKLDAENFVGVSVLDAFQDKIYREIQKVGSGDGSDTASLVEFADEFKDKHPLTPPPRIRLRVANSSTLKLEHLKWTPEVQDLIRQHRSAIKGHLGMPG